MSDKDPKANDEAVVVEKTGEADVPANNTPEVEDAHAKEMVAYALGGVAGQIANSDMWLKQNLLMFVLQINPLLIAFMGIFGSIWDAITDPIMANITDNFKSRWGRRRPFILVGGILAALFSVLVWANFPKNDKIVKNVKVVPEVVQSEDALKKFGDMLRGYGINQTKLALTTPAEIDPENPVNNVEVLLREALGKIGAGVSLVDDDPNALPLTLTTEGFGPDRLEAALKGQVFSASLTLGDRDEVNNTLTIEDDYPQKRGFQERAGNFFNGRSAYIGFSLDGEQIDYRRNSYEQQGVVRARMTLLDKAIIEALGEHYNLPYWKCFPEKGDGGKMTLRQDVTLGTLADTDPAGLIAADAEVYAPLFDTFLSSIEKRKKYNTLKHALENEAIDLETEKLLATLSEVPEDLAAVREGLLAGKISKRVAGLLSGKCLNVTDEEVEAARAQLVAEAANNSHQDYVVLHAKFLLYGLGYNMDLLHPELTDADRAEIEPLMENLSGTEELYAFLWAKNHDLMEKNRDKHKAGTIGLLNYMKADAMLGHYLNPKFKGKKAGNSEKFKQGLVAFGTNPQDDKIALYMIVALVVLATFNTIRGVPYFALGIELAPSYDGRTKVIAIRSVMSKVVALMNPWLFPLVLLPIFSDGINGAMWLGITCAVVSIPMLIYSMKHVKERTVLDKKRKKVPFFKSIKQTASVPEFWRVLALFLLLQNSLGLVTMATGYLIIYWVFGGALKAGASYLAIQQTMGYLMALFAVPFITWICNKFEKHNALRFALFMLVLNALLSWVCYNPDKPYLMLILPLFGSIGISSLYTVMGTLMADVTDADELKNGSRREGMFGAVNGMVMKAVAPIGAVMASIVVIFSGFDVDMGVHQESGVFTVMRILLVCLPLCFMTIAFILLYKYPLTRARMMEIKAELKRRHERIAREEAIEDAKAAELSDG